MSITQDNNALLHDIEWEDTPIVPKISVHGIEGIDDIFDNEVYSIDLNTRKINAPKMLGVTQDHYSNKVFFEVDRYYDNTDLLGTVCIVMYRRPDKEEGIYVVPYFYYDEDNEKIVFYWNISGRVTELPGAIEFAIKFFRTNRNSTGVIYELNTLIAKSEVLKGVSMEFGNAAVGGEASTSGIETQNIEALFQGGGTPISLDGLAKLDEANTFTAKQTFSSGIATTDLEVSQGISAKKAAIGQDVEAFGNYSFAQGQGHSRDETYTIIPIVGQDQNQTGLYYIIDTEDNIYINNLSTNSIFFKQEEDGEEYPLQEYYTIGDSVANYGGTSNRAYYIFPDKIFDTNGVTVYKYFGGIAVGDYSHAEGQYSIAIGANSHSEGQYSKTLDANSHAEGNNSISKGTASHAEGLYTEAYGNQSHAEGAYSLAYGNYSHAEGSNRDGTAQENANPDNIFIKLTPAGSGLALGLNENYSYYSYEFLNNKTAPLFVHSIILSSFYTDLDIMDIATVEINNEDVTVLGFSSTPPFFGAAETNGRTFTVGKLQAHAAYGAASHIEGQENIAVGIAAHAEGIKTAAIGNASHTSGMGTKALVDYQTVVGKYNKTHNDNNLIDALFVVGNGTAANPNNAMTVTSSGAVIANSFADANGIIHGIPTIPSGANDAGKVLMAEGNSSVGWERVIPSYTTTNDEGKVLKVGSNNNLIWGTDNVGSGGTTYSTFSTSADGLVPAASTNGDTDKFLKGDGTWATPFSGAAYTLPAATTSDLGGIKTNYTTPAGEKKYPVKLDSNNDAYVEVPWTDTDTDTTYGLASTSANGLVPSFSSSNNGQVLKVIEDSQNSGSYILAWQNDNTGSSGTTLPSYSGSTNRGKVLKVNNSNQLVWGEDNDTNYLHFGYYLEDPNNAGVYNFYGTNATTTLISRARGHLYIDIPTKKLYCCYDSIDGLEYYPITV